MALRHECQQCEGGDGRVMRVIAVAPGAIGILLLLQPFKRFGGGLLARLVHLDLDGPRRRSKEQDGQRQEGKKQTLHDKNLRLPQMNKRMATKNTKRHKNKSCSCFLFVSFRVFCGHFHYFFSGVTGLPLATFTRYCWIKLAYSGGSLSFIAWRISS